MSYLKEKLLELTKRVYRLTLFFPKKEPLRYKIRELADEILAKFLSQKVTQNPKLLELEVLNAFFEVAKEQNWVSPKEISEIQAEYLKIKELRERKVPQTPQNLNERQKKILEILKEKGKIQVWQVKDAFPETSKRTLRRDFQKLWKLGLIERVGSKNNTFYTLKQ